MDKLLVSGRCTVYHNLKFHGNVGMGSEIPSAIRLTIHACRGFCTHSLGCLGWASRKEQLMRKRAFSVLTPISYNMISCFFEVYS